MQDKLKNMFNCSDIPNKEDHLNIAPYYRGLAKFIQEADTPLTVSIQGEWGSGKTSALAKIEELIAPRDDEKAIDKFCDPDNRERNCHVIWFNTWQYSCLGVNDNLTLALFTHLKSELAELQQNKEDSNIKSALKTVRHALLKGGLKSISDAIGIGGLFESANELVDMLAKADNVPLLTEVITSLKVVIQEMINCLVPDGKRLVIFVDDLDRLEPKVAVELLSGIKNLLDCEKCIFVLAVDKEVIINGVKEKYGAFYNDTKKANQFFDKLIQVPFSLPTQKYDIQYLLEQEYLADIPAEWKGKYVRVVQALFQNNPRSIKRAFQSWRLHRYIFTELTNAREIYNLFVILAFRLVDEELYSHLVEPAQNNNLEKLSGILFREEGYTNVEIIIGKYLELPSLSYADIMECLSDESLYKGKITEEHKKTRNRINKAEEEWKNLLSILMRTPDMHLFYNVENLVFSEEVRKIIQKIQDSQNYTMEYFGNSLCEFKDSEGREVLVFYRKRESGQERLVVYKTKTEEAYEGNFEKYCTSHTCGCPLTSSENHVTILLDQVEKLDKYADLEKFLRETLELF